MQIIIICFCIGSTRESHRPLLTDLYDHVVNETAHKWRDLGVKLLRPDQENLLNIIAADHPHDAISCCKSVLKKWLDTTTDATWNELIRALKSPTVELVAFAEQLEQMLITECKTKYSCILLNSMSNLYPLWYAIGNYLFGLSLFYRMARHISEALFSETAPLKS